MDIAFFLKGLILGFSIAAPVGPIGLLCIQRTLEGGRLLGLVTGLGAATADAAYGSVAGFSLTFVSRFLVNQQGWLGLVGGLFLIYLGVRILFSRPAEEAAPAQHNGLGKAYASTLFLTLTNPMTILSFTAVFAGLGIGAVRGDYYSAAFLVAGVFCGSALWWLLLSGGVGALREKVDARALTWVQDLGHHRRRIRAGGPHNGAERCALSTEINKEESE